VLSHAKRAVLRVTAWCQAAVFRVCVGKEVWCG
jgi:hypothetical protein